MKRVERSAGRTHFFTTAVRPRELERREFLRMVGGGALAGWLGAGTFGCGGGTAAGAHDGATGDAADGGAIADLTPLPFPIEEATIADLQTVMVSGRATSRSLCEQYLMRIALVNTAGPELRALLEANPDALAIADRLDAERRMNMLRGPLHGIPIFIKGNIATADAMSSTAGSLALLGEKTAADATVVKKLRAAGAVILGKANLSEWANFRSTMSISGWSAQGGQCKNPYALDRDPSGSSTGSAVGVAANLCAVAIGSETDGSITTPSSSNGIVGLKPTVGLVSRWGVIPISASQDTAGPMARTVRDAAILLGVIAGADAADPATAQIPGIPDYAAGLDANGLKGARIGLLSPGQSDAGMQAAQSFRDAATALGAIVSDAALPKYGQWGNAEIVVLEYEFKAGIADYLRQFAPTAKVRSLADLIAFNLAHTAEEMPLFKQELFLQSQARGPLTDAAYVSALDTCRRTARAGCLDAAFATYGVDAFACVTQSPACAPRGYDPAFSEYVSGAAVAGYPHLTVPGGFVDDLPIGISFIGTPYTEATLLKLGYAFEQATHHRMPPRLLATSAYPGC